MSIDSVKTTDATSKVQKFEKKPEFEPQSWEDSIAVIAMETARVFKDARHLLPGLAIVTTNQSVAVDSLEKLLLPPGYETKSSIIHFNSSDKRTQVEALLKDKTEAEKKDIARAFKEKTGKSLEDAFKVNFDGHVWESVVGWFRKSDKSSGDAERIRVALVERSQTFAGRSDKTCEKDLLDTISTLNSTQIAELSKEYKEKYGVALEDALLKDRYLGERTKQALQILLKGANRVTDVDTFDRHR